MTITEALEKGKGRAELPGVAAEYAAVDKSGALMWFNGRFQPEIFVSLDAICRRTDWRPYSPESVRCEACREADELEARHDFLMYPFNSSFVRHLRSHCTCKKEAP